MAEAAGHSIVEALESARATGREVYFYDGSRWKSAYCGGALNTLKWSSRSAVNVKEHRLRGWAVPDCQAGEDGGPCLWCEGCPEIGTPERDRGEYVWFTLTDYNGALAAEVPQRTFFGDLIHEPLHAEILPSAHIPGFEVVGFARKIGKVSYDMMDAPWEPDYSHSFYNGKSSDSRRSGPRDELEQLLKGTDRSYIVATHVIMRRV